MKNSSNNNLENVVMFWSFITASNTVKKSMLFNQKHYVKNIVGCQAYWRGLKITLTQ